MCASTFLKVFGSDFVNVHSRRYHSRYQHQSLDNVPSTHSPKNTPPALSIYDELLARNKIGTRCPFKTPHTPGGTVARWRTSHQDIEQVLGQQCTSVQQESVNGMTRNPAHTTLKALFWQRPTLPRHNPGKVASTRPPGRRLTIPYPNRFVL